jgi:hypothetical protein
MMAITQRLCMSRHVSSMRHPHPITAIARIAPGVSTSGVNAKGASIGANAMNGAHSSGESTAIGTAGMAAAISMMAVDKNFSVFSGLILVAMTLI